MIETFGFLIVVITWAPYFIDRLARALHIFQLEEYQANRFLGWIVRTPARGVDRFALLFGFISVFLAAADPPFNLAGIALWSFVHLIRWIRRPKHEAKKPLVWTPRAKRMFGVALTIAVVLTILRRVVGYPDFWAPMLVLLVLGQATGLLIVIANIVAQPIESQVRRSFLSQARAKVRRLNPIVIAVAGSYGKTTSKEITAALVSRLGPTLKPPGNTNTLLGVCRLINEKLLPEHRYFVVEMGDYVRGDIRDLCRLTPPNIGLLTTIGPEHLERFGSMENVELAKLELLEALPANGTIALNSDDSRLRGFADRASQLKVVRYGLDPAGQPDVTANNVRYGADGIAFELIRPDRPPLPVRSVLLGRHNVSNLLGGIAVATELGISDEDLLRTIPTIEPAEHRLQIMPPTGGATVIDDSYNANPVGVANALEVLKQMPGRQKVLVTPGIVELGEIEAEENRKVGEKASRACDWVILVGPRRTAPIAAGLRSGGLASDRIVVTRTLTEATERLRQIVGPGDVVLFCNDLPDQYDET